MRSVWVWVVTAGCRIGFSDDAVTTDSRPAPDGVARDGALLAPYPQAVLADSPLAYFRFDEPGGSIAASVVGDVRGTYEGDFVFGVPGAAGAGDTTVLFDGSTTRIELGDVFRFPGTAPYSLEAWILPTDVASTRFIAFRRATSINAGYQFYVGDTYTIFSRQNTMEFGYVGTDAPALATWTHLVVTYTGTVQLMYVNGIEVSRNGGNVSEPIDEGPGGFSIGDTTPGQFYKFEGRIDEFAIYDHPLTAERVLAHFEAAQPQ